MFPLWFSGFVNTPSFRTRPSRQRTQTATRLQRSASSKNPVRHVVVKSDFGSMPKPENEDTSSNHCCGSVHLIGTGPGDPRLLTLGAVELMRKADVVLHDRLVSNSILEYVNPDAEKICVGKGRGIGTGSQETIQEQLVYHAKRGKRVVRLKGGDPSVFGRVGNEMQYLRKYDITVSMTPGITTASGVAASLGFPLTHSGVAEGVCLITGHLGATWITLSSLTKVTLVVYMGLQELPNLFDRLRKGGALDPIPAVAVQSGTTSFQRVVFGTTSNLAEKVKSAKLRSPTIIIVGNTVRMATDWPGD